MLKIVSDDGAEHRCSDVERLWIELDDLLLVQQGDGTPDSERPDLFRLRQALNNLGLALREDGVLHEAVMS